MTGSQVLLGAALILALAAGWQIIVARLMLAPMSGQPSWPPLRSGICTAE
jgi:hypothetical protein